MKNSSPFGDFVWFQGVVEDVNDPKQIGRVRVRAIGYHTEDRNDLPHDLLPWAPMMNGAAAMSAPLVLPGDWVVGFFMDGHEAQQPMVMGSFIGIPTQKDKETGFNDPSGTWPRKLNVPTNSHAARGEKDVADYKDKTKWQNPVVFAAKYPFNHVMETDKGALFELDDTEGSERVHIFHHKGSYVEFLPDGTIVIKSVKERWDVTFANHTMLVNGDLTVGATGNMKFIAGKDMKFSAGGSMNLASASELNLGAGGGGTFVTAGTLGLKGSTLDAQGSASDSTGGVDSVPVPGDTSTYEPKVS